MRSEFPSGLPREALADHHTIETPEQMSLHMALAGIGSRFLAVAIDTLIQIFAGLATLLLLAVFGYTGVFSAESAMKNWVLAAAGIFTFLLLYGYYAIFEIFWNGQTPGKRYVGIRVIKDSGRPLTAGETIGRNLMRIVDQLPFFYVIGILTALFTAQHQRLGDLLVGALVVRETSLAELKAMWNAPPEVLNLPGNMPGVTPVTTPALASGLTMADLTLIDAFLARRHSLTDAVRHATASQIVARLRARLPEGVDTSGPAEAILEALAYHMRSTGQRLD